MYANNLQTAAAILLSGSSYATTSRFDIFQSTAFVFTASY